MPPNRRWPIWSSQYITRHCRSTQVFAVASTTRTILQHRHFATDRRETLARRLASQAAGEVGWQAGGAPLSPHGNGARDASSRRLAGSGRAVHTLEIDCHKFSTRKVPQLARHLFECRLPPSENFAQGKKTDRHLGPCSTRGIQS